MSRCFSDESLRRLGDDDLDPALFEVMERHVQGCSRCGLRLEALARECLGPTGFDHSGVSESAATVLELEGFLIEAEIGRGAMGVVHLARDLRLGRRVALKILSQPGVDARRRWLREARAVSSVRHPNVVSLYDCREVGPWFVLILEHIPGGSLEKRISGPLAPRAAAGLMEKIARAVAYVHHQGVLHLDLKPSNILLDGEGGGAWERTNPLISDFGLAVFREDGGGAEPTQDGPRGTPVYMAPEQMAERVGKLGPSADVYSLGVILYELLTGRPPFRAASPYETMELARTQDAVPLRRLNSRVPRDLETIVHKCLEKTPGRRYESAEAIADDLRRWLEGRTIKARPVSLAERSWRVCRRHRNASILILALAATVVASMGLLLDAYTRADAARKAAEQNFEIASTVIERLEEIVLVALNEHRSIDPEGIESATNLLEEQVRRARRGRAIQGFNIDILAGLSRIEERLAERYILLGRFDDALFLLLRELDLVREYRAVDPENASYRRIHVGALRLASFAGERIGRWDEALDHLDAATDLILNTSPPLPDQLSIACFGCERYLILHDRLARAGRQDAARRASDGCLKLMRLFEGQDPARPGQQLFLAVVLVARGELERAREVFARVTAGPRPPENTPAWIRQETLAASTAWFSRELGLWTQDVLKREMSVEAVGRAVDDYLARFIQANRALGIEGIPELQSHDVCTLGTDLRRAGRIEDAERAAAVFLALVSRYVQSYPDQPASYRELSEAYIQQSKNAWKRDDLREVRQAMSRAIDSLQKAQQLAPNDDLIRYRIVWTKRRFDALPPEPATTNGPVAGEIAKLRPEEP
jgi:eukaryotic-like serine/threonine-protein kinase